jgi:hypothetical protein
MAFLLHGTQSRGRTGISVKILVFETSASTDSAIWASPAEVPIDRDKGGALKSDSENTYFLLTGKKICETG